MTDSFGMDRGQPYGIHFLTIGASAGDMIVVPRCWRICLLVRLIIPWRLFAWVEMTLPVPVRRKRFLTPDLVFILGIWLSFGPRSARRKPRSPEGAIVACCCCEHRPSPRQPCRPGDGRRA